MTGITRVALFGKLSPLAYRSIEAGSIAAKMRGHARVTLGHWLHQVLQFPDSDLHHVMRRFHLNPEKLSHDLTAALDALPRGQGQGIDMAPEVEAAAERGWVAASLVFGADRIRTGHLLAGILQTPDLRDRLPGLSREFRKLTLEPLLSEFAEITDGSPEVAAAVTPGPITDGDSMAPAVIGKQEALRKFSVDLTERARAGKIDPIVGREEEIRRVVDVLMRRRQNNPILTGEAGVGKTAVVEGLALRIATGDVPPALRDVQLRTLDIGLLQAGASVKGEFENRLRQVIEEVQSSPRPIILFIDEAHTLIGAGGAAGTGDAANLLKPALARGDLRTVAATTWAEYKKYFEKDPALTRRFQVVQVEEPDETTAIAMMRGIAASLEKHHRVQLMDEAIEAAVRLSHRYIPARQLPDKAVSLLDTAAARVAISQHAVPAQIDDSRCAIATLRTEMEIIAREKAVGVDVAEREAAAAAAIADQTARLTALETRWEEEKRLAADIEVARGELRASPADDAAGDRAARLAALRALETELSTLQGDAPMILPTVNEQAVAAVVQDWTGIPVGRMVRDEVETVLTLADTLKRRVIGQGHGLEMIARRIQTARARLDNPSKPIGVFMLCGPSGVGKTETALALAETLYGGEQNLITINMSEFQEAHTVSTLKGAPPGYVGYGEGGVLTEAVRRRPYSVVLLDEVEKAHPDVHEIFFQVFDKGVMEDGEGRRIDFKNTLILLTSNVGSDLVMSMCRDPDLTPEPDGIAKALRDPLLKVFPAALLGRIVTIPYYPLSDEMLSAIVRLQMERIRRRVEANHKIPFTYSDAAVRLVVDRCTELESGGRMIDAILTNSLLPEISGEFLRRLAAGRSLSRVHVDVVGGELGYSYD